MSKVIVVTNQKGGVAKSTTVAAFSTGLRAMQYKTLVIDLDPQGNISHTMNSDPNKPTVYEVLTGQAAVRESIQQTNQGDMIAASIILSGADKELMDKTGKEYRLKEALQFVMNDYDYIIIDTPPSLNILTINALTTADGVIIPVGADMYSIQGVGQLNETIQTVKKYCNPTLQVKGILLTKHNNRTVLSKDLSEVVENVAKQINTIVYDTTIRTSVSVMESQVQQVSLMEYAPKSTAAKDYAAFVNEFIQRETQGDG